jgi:hypothetical protein
VRFVYHRYMANVNFLQCPFLPFWDRTEKALPLGAARIYVDNMQIPGFFRDHNNGVLEKNPWVKSSRRIFPTDDEIGTRIRSVGHRCAENMAVL